MVPVETELPLRILHLEDSFADHRLTTLTLRQSGVPAVLSQVDTLTDFAAAVADTVFDVILADYQLAGFTALDAWQIVSATPHAPPVILFSGAIGEAAAVIPFR